MSEIRNYPSALQDPASRRFETFSYLPPMDEQRIRAQLAYITGHGWSPAIEHTEPDNAAGHYWYMWKLPMFGEAGTARILDEIEACHRANPGHQVRLVAYDNLAQTLGTAMVIHRGPTQA